MVIHDGFKSQPCSIILYTYNDRLEGLRCCAIPESIQKYSMLLEWNVGAFCQNCHHPWLKRKAKVWWWILSTWPKMSPVRTPFGWEECGGIYRYRSWAFSKMVVSILPWTIENGQVHEINCIGWFGECPSEPIPYHTILLLSHIPLKLCPLLLEHCWVRIHTPDINSILNKSKVEWYHPVLLSPLQTDWVWVLGWPFYIHSTNS